MMKYSCNDCSIKNDTICDDNVILLFTCEIMRHKSEQISIYTCAKLLYIMLQKVLPRFSEIPFRDKDCATLTRFPTYSSVVIEKKKSNIFIR